jgi:hypothetical protein
MVRLRRLGAVVLLLLGALLFAPTLARADHCPPIDNPDPVPGQNREWCHTPKPTPKPPEPETPAPTVAPTQAPAPAPRLPVTTRQPVSTPDTTPFPVEVDTTADPGATPEIVVTGPVDGAQAPLEVENTASASSWIFGFIVGFIIGGLAGRASWGLRKRRRQQIFG